jgi:nitrile hydratase beta subunit
MDGVHDMGGMHGFGEVVQPGGELVFHQDWEPRVFALHMLIADERLGAGPGGRATREEMDPADYLAASYYERWLWSAERRLERAGTIVAGEVEGMMRRLSGGEPAPTSAETDMAARVVAELGTRHPMRPADARAVRFAVGERVRVRRMHPAGHTRCPRYARGAAGEVRGVRGLDRLPDRAVYGEPAEPEPVYSIAFSSAELWGPGEDAAWTVRLDLWESYLEAE